MEKLIDSGKITGVIDVTTTEICDMLMGGIFPATEDRFGAVIRRRLPYIGSVGALDMVNFGAPETVPEKYRGRTFYEHNPQVTLMRTTAEECRAMGRWIGGRLNRDGGAGPLLPARRRGLGPRCAGPAVPRPGRPPRPLHRARGHRAADRTRQLVRLPHHINDPAFAAAVVAAFRDLHGAHPAATPARKREARR
jgi:uncharacterized protein (UPF0261 family)